MSSAAPGREILARAAIAGLGITETGKVYGRSAADFAADVVRLAVADAGLTLEDVDGLILANGISGGVDFRLQKELGLRNLRLQNEVSAAGATAITGFDGGTTCADACHPSSTAIAEGHA